MPFELGYFTIPLPDIARGMKFYAALFGWTFEEPNPGYAHVNNTKPPMGLSPGQPMDFSTLYFAVTDVKASVEQVRALGGTASEVKEYPSGLNSLCTDDQGTKFSLWQPAPGFET
ncbi:MAG TPA: VOC family protein [Rhizomicrobium sp.]|jgi:hypothetical protein|nr:VOC family protein [Rhizomicrobium sp.]